MSNYTNDILLAVFFKKDVDTADLLFVSFDGLNFYEIGTVYNDGGINSRDPSIIYRNGELWSVFSPYNTSRGRQPRWGHSSNVGNWGTFTNGGVSITANSNKPYNMYGVENNTDFDAVASEGFVDGNDVWMITSLGYFGAFNNLAPKYDTMRPYLIKVTSLSSNSITYNDAIPIKLPQNMITDERGDVRQFERSLNVTPEDRIDGALYKENGIYYLVVKRFGNTTEIWSIGSLNNVSNPYSWTLVNSDILIGYEGACLVKFRGNYYVYADLLRKPNICADTGIHVTSCGQNGLSGLWKDPTRINLKYKNGSYDADYNTAEIGRHGTVMVVSAGTDLHTKVMQRFYAKGYTYSPSNNLQPWMPDMSSGWFRSNGKRYLKNNGNLLASCEYNDGSHWYWFDSDGSMARNKDVYISNFDKWVHYDNDGWMIYGEQWCGPQFYYYDIYKLFDDELQTHYYYEYYFDPITGKMAHGFIEVDGQPRHYDEITGRRIYDV